MSYVPPRDTGPASALSGFWRDVFDDSGLLAETLRGAEHLLAENWADTLRLALALSLDETPMFRRASFLRLEFRRSQVRRRLSTGEWVAELPPDVVHVALLQDRVLRPRWLLEEGLHFRIAPTLAGGRAIVFAADPFIGAYAPVSLRDPDATRTVWGDDGAVDVGVADSALPEPTDDYDAYVAAANARYLLRRTFTTAGRREILRGASATPGREDGVDVPRPVFQESDEGLLLRFSVDGTSSDRVITQVVDAFTVHLDSALPAGLPGVFDCAVVHPEPFQPESVGCQIVIDDAWTDDPPMRRTIVEVVDARTVLLDRAVDVDPERTEGVRAAAWALEAPIYEDVLTVYAADALTDPRDLARVHGTLLGRADEPSTTQLRSYLRAAQAFFWRGPTVRATEALLQAAAGLPLILHAGEILARATVQGLNAIIETDRAAYALPADVCRQDLFDRNQWGVLTFRELEGLSDAFSVTDTSVDPLWVWKRTLPETVAPTLTVTERRVDPQLRPLRLDGSIRVGDLNTYLAHDVDGGSLIPFRHEGADLFVVDDGSAYGASVFVARAAPSSRWLGRQGVVEGYTVQWGSIDGVELSNDTDMAELVAARAREVTASGDQLTRTSGLPWRNWDDVGRWVLVDGDYYQITSVEDTDVVTVVDTNGDAPTLSWTGLATVALRYVVYEREVMHLGPGFVRGSLAAPNLFQVSWDASRFPAETTALGEEIEQVLRVGRPAWAQIIATPFWPGFECFGATDVLGAQVDVAPAHVYATRRELYIDDGVELTSIFWDANGQVERRWGSDELAALPATPAAAGVLAANVVIADDATACTLDIYSRLPPGETASVSVYLWDSEDLEDVGGSWVATGSTFALVTGSAGVTLSPAPGVWALLLDATSDPAWTVAASLDRNAMQTEVGLLVRPSGTASIVEGDDSVLLELPGGAHEGLDEGTILSLSYPAVPADGTPAYSDTVWVVGIEDADELQLLDFTTGEVYAAPRGGADIEWRYLGNWAWGQTPRRLHHEPPLSMWPIGGTSRIGRMTCVPATIRVVL